ncbi:hypothetical protein pb186bvf_012593 [Paramecium bursaria]
MKIIGIGVDIVSNQRMQKILTAQYAERFLVKTLHVNEINHIKQMKANQEQFLASRWAIKESLVKASKNTDLIFPQIEILNQKVLLYGENLKLIFNWIRDINIIMNNNGDRQNSLPVGDRSFDDSQIVYKNVRKANLPLTANIAYCEIRITELMATLEAIQRKNNELEELKDSYITFQESMNQLNDRNEILMSENTKLAQALKQKSRESEYLQIRILELSGQVDNLRNVEDDLKSIRDQHSLQERIIRELTERNADLEKKYLLTSGLQMTCLELTNRVSNLDEDLGISKERSVKLEQECKRLQDLLKEQQLKNPQSNLAESLKQQNSKEMKTSTSNLEQSKFKEQFYQIGQDLQTARQGILEKDHKLELLQIELNKLQEKLANRDEQISQLTVELTKYEQQDKELALLKQTISERPQGQRIVEKEVQIVKDTNESDTATLVKQINDLNIQLEKQKLKTDQLQLKLDTYEKLNGDLLKENRIIPKLQYDLEMLQVDKKNLLNQLKQLQNQFQSTLEVVKSQQIGLQNQDQSKFDIQLLEEQLIQKQKEILELKQQVSTLQFENMVIANLEAKLAESKKLIEKLKQKIDQTLEQKKKISDKLTEQIIQINLLKNVELKHNSLKDVVIDLRKQIEEAGAESEKWRAKYNQGQSEIMKLTKLVETHQQRQKELSQFKQKEYKVPEVVIQAASKVERIDKVVVEDETRVKLLQNQALSLQLELESIGRSRVFETQENQRQIDALIIQLNFQKSEYLKLKEKYLQSEQQIAQFLNIQEKLNDQEVKAASLQILTEGLQEKLREKTSQNQQLNQQLFTQELELKNLEQLQKDYENLKEKLRIINEENTQLNQRIPKLLLQNLEQAKNIVILEGKQNNAPVISNDNSSALKQKIVELEQQVDDGSQQLVKQLQNRVTILENELKKQLDSNTQLVKEVQNSERKRQDSQIEFHQMQAKEIDAYQLRQFYQQKMKEADALRIQLTKAESRAQEIQQSVEILALNETDYKNQIERLKIINHNQNLQIVQLLSTLNHLEQQVIDATNTSKLYPDLKNQIQQLSQQNDELTNERDTLNYEIEDFIAQIKKLEQQVIQLTPLKDQVSFQKEVIHHNHQELKSAQLKTQEVEKQRIKLNEEWTNKYDELARQIKNIDHLEAIKKELEFDVDSLHGEILALGQQNKELKAQLVKNQNEIDLRDIEIKRLQQIERDFKKVVDSYQNEINKNQDLNEKFSNLQQDYQQSQKEFQKAEVKANQLQNEVERQLGLIKGKNQEIENQKQNLVQNQIQLDQIQPTQSENKRLLTELNNNLRTIEEVKIQNQQLQKQIDELKRQLDNEDINKQNLINELQKFENVVRLKDEEQNELKNLIRNHENSLKDLKKDEQQWSTLESELQKTTNELNYLNNLLDERIQEIDQLQKENHRLQIQLLENQKLDFDHLELTLRSRDKEIEQLKERYQKFQSDQGKFMQERNEFDNKMGGLELEIERWKRKCQSIQGETVSLRSMIEQLNVEIERLNKHCIDQLKDNEEWRIRYGNLQSQIPALVSVQPATDKYVVGTPGGSFRIPPPDRDSFRNGTNSSELRKSARRSHTILKQ